ncbi:NACHT domain-containing protein [Psychrobacter glaciei]|uniref:NACHT domain-containing protein n=1 Tax=Psychrobacter glaciei TaxID=619771 RepID=UPI001F05AB25|nr:ATP-binding protein [Psychrobacter glaciei]MCH1783113.1 ATP-binding protein [Psychrobacter glaciei]
MQSYIARNLEYEARNKEGTLETIILEDSQLLDIAQSKPIVILADAGMGKTELMKELAKPSHIKTKYLSASDLVQKSVKRLSIQPDETLLIDAFDEIPSTKDSSGIDSVLNRLAELNYPKFILTCRSIEWNNSNKNEIQSTYKDILTTNLTNLSREDAEEFLQSRSLSSENVSQLIHQLEENSLSSFYENPRNLALLAEIDFSVHPVPETKTKLFKLATEKLWQEVNPKAQNALGSLHPEQVIECAGLIFAIYLLAGKQFIYKGMTGSTPDDAINLHSLTDLINSETLESTIQSRLFQSVETELFKPWHRSVAEYLGAKWLAKAMSSPRIKRHILSYLIFDEGVVASLRGLFAWLPTFNPNLSEIVIKTDPYGLIEYGDTNYFSDTDSVLLFDALEELTVDNPWFRRNNYLKKTRAEGLVSRSLLKKYKDILSNKEGNFHFLTTILEALRDADFIEELADELFAIFYDDGWPYSARSDSLMLLHASSLINTSADFNPLIEKGSHSSLRLVFEHCVKHGYELITDEQVISLIMKSYSFNLDNTRLDENFTPQNGSYYYFLEYPVDRIFQLLKSIRRNIIALKIDRYDYNDDTVRSINDIIITLIQRYISESQQTIDLLILYQSISIFHEFSTSAIGKNASEFFVDYFQKNPKEKTQIQKYFLKYSDKDFGFHLLHHTVLHSVVPNKENIRQLLAYLQLKNVTELTVYRWKYLIDIYCGRDAISDELYKLALPYAQSNQLLKYLDSKKKPIIFEWDIKRKRRSLRRELDEKLRFQRIRNDLYPHQVDLENGDAKFCNYPAKILLYKYSNTPDDLEGVDKVNHIFKENLTNSAIKGFEASLHYSVPNISELIQNQYPIEPVLIAGIYCRLLRGDSLSDLSDDVILACSFILDHDNSLGFKFHGDEEPKLCETIRDEIISRSLKNTVINEMFIPQFQTDCTRIRGLHWVYGEDVDELSIDTIVNLLNTYPKMHSETKNRFIDTLINNDALTRIDDLIIANVKAIPNIDENIETNSRWLSLLSIVDNKKFPHYLRCAQYPKSIFWQLKETYHESRLTKNFKMSLTLMSWIAYRFSYSFSKTDMPTGGFSGNRHPYDASNFITFCLSEISNITTFEAQVELRKLKNCVHSSYTVFITNLLAEQANNIRDANYQAPMLDDLLNIFQNKAPLKCKELKTLILELLDEIQKKVKSSELDTYKMFYEDGENKNPQKPHGENYCRDRLADLLKPYIEPYQFRLDTEKDMSDDKRADLVCNSSEMQLPIEVKGQWHPDLWTAMNDQLGDLYLKEYQSQGQGIYLIFYFGENVTKKPKGNSNYKPQNALELKRTLTVCIKEKYKEGIDVFVMDLSLEDT